MTYLQPVVLPYQRRRGLLRACPRPVCYVWASKASSMPSMNVATAANTLSKYDSASRPSLYRNSSHVPILLLAGSSGKGK